MRSLSIIQPVYLPWLGYFEQIARTDVFVLYDEVQYTKQDWRNRNRIPGAQGPVWLTVPVRRAPLGTPIHAIRIDTRHRWAAKHLRSVTQAYGRAPYYDPWFARLRAVLEQGWDRLVDLDAALIRLICGGFGIDTPMVRSSEAPGDPAFAGQFDTAAADPGVARRNLRLVELCRRHGADLFYVGAKAADYIDRDLFARFGIRVVFQEYRHPAYPQPGRGMQTHMAAIDLLMMTGPGARDVLLSPPGPDFTEGQGRRPPARAGAARSDP